MTNNLTMSTMINIADLKARLSEFVGMAEAGEEVLVCRRNLPVARLVPLAAAPGGTPRKLSDIRGWLDDGDDFQRQLDERRTRAAEQRKRDPFA
jgi:prevent-host-death family protein